MIFWILIAGVLYTVFDLFVAKASAHSDAYMANFIFNGLGAVIPVLIFLVLKARHATGHTSKYGIVMSIVAGVAIAVFSIILVKLFAHGGNLAYILPVIYGVVVILSGVFGHFFLKETISTLQLAGILVTALGVGMVIAAKV